MTATESVLRGTGKFKGLSIVGAPSRPSIGLVIGNQADRQVMTAFLSELGYAVTVPCLEHDGVDLRHVYDLLIVDQGAVQRHGEIFQRLRLEHSS